LSQLAVRTIIQEQGRAAVAVAPVIKECQDIKKGYDENP
jgi:hypothetical protein